MSIFKVDSPQFFEDEIDMDKVFMKGVGPGGVDNPDKLMNISTNLNRYHRIPKCIVLRTSSKLWELSTRLSKLSGNCTGNAVKYKGKFKWYRDCNTEESTNRDTKEIHLEMRRETKEYN